MAAKVEFGRELVLVFALMDVSDREIGIVRVDIDAVPTASEGGDRPEIQVVAQPRMDVFRHAPNANVIMVRLVQGNLRIVAEDAIGDRIERSPQDGEAGGMLLRARIIGSGGRIDGVSYFPPKLTVSSATVTVEDVVSTRNDVLDIRVVAHVARGKAELEPAGN